MDKDHITVKHIRNYFSVHEALILGETGWLAVCSPIHPKILNGVDFLRTNTGNPFLYGPGFVQGGCHQITQGLLQSVDNFYCF